MRRTKRPGRCERRLTAAYTEAVAIDAIRAAYDALGRGDVEPLVSLMDEEMEWRGRRRGWRFWCPPPS
jgi:ketosteroid isomerase-like protein